MLKDFINNERNERPYFGVSVYRCNKYILKTAAGESFNIRYASVLLIKSGTFKIGIGGSVLNMEPHDFLILPEKLPCTEMEAGGTLQFFLITFSAGKELYRLKTDTLINSFYVRGGQVIKLRLESTDYQVLSLICRLMYTAENGLPPNDFNLELLRLSSSLLFFELKYIYSKYITSSGLFLSKSEILTVQFLNILSIHCRKHHNVKFYAGVLYVTPEYLNRAVREAVGKTTKNLITEAILAEAAQMLADSTYSIAEIASELEFSSSTAFGIFFKKWMSCTPLEFRSNAAERFKSR